MSDPNERRRWRTDDEWARLHARLSTASGGLPERRRIQPWMWAAAAIIVVALPATLLFTRRTNRTGAAKAPEVRTVSTKVGERTVVHLADSSTITLAPATTVQIIVDGIRRDVHLEGMADFHVVHDASRAFVVHAGDAVTTDVGTRFVVRAYRGDSSVRVAVTEGSVSVQWHESSPAILLTAGEVALVRGRSASKLLSSAAPMYAAWTEGGLSFDDVALRDAIAELQRWFDVDIRLEGAIGNRRVSAVYNDAKLDPVLDALAIALDLTYTRNGRVVTFRARGGR